MVVVALFVAPGGVYFNQPGIDPWDEARDARRYLGPDPVVAHPPCQRWGRYWHGGPSARARMTKGDDNGCFESALRDVRAWGGVLEHPEASHAWPAFGLHKPPKSGGWVLADGQGGVTCCVEQGHYGHRARKATWLYLFGHPNPPELKWGPSAARVRLDAGYHSAEERARMMKPPRGTTSEQRAARRARLEWYGRTTGKEWCCPERLNKAERTATPVPFRDLLVSLASECGW